MSTQKCDRNDSHLKEWPPDQNWKYIKDTNGEIVAQEKFCAVECIGKGGFGEVYKGHSRIHKLTTGATACGRYDYPDVYAMKILKYPEKTASVTGKDTSSNHSKETKSSVKSRIKREFDVHIALRDNDAIVKPIASYKWPDRKPEVAILVMEYCPNKDLDFT